MADRANTETCNQRYLPASPGAIRQCRTLKYDTYRGCARAQRPDRRWCCHLPACSQRHGELGKRSQSQ